ncbi:MAG: hypothetical protein AAF548_06875 [Actinomycetota bacterium]
MTDLRFPRTLLTAVVACLVLLAGCSGDDDTSESGAPLGILAPGSATHLGTTWFSPPSDEHRTRILERWEEATEASSVGRVMVDWIDVEPTEGDYRFADVDEHLETIAAQGLQPMVSVVAVDVSGTDFPTWLGGFDPTRAATAYLAMAEQLAPLMERHDVWLFAIANEPPLTDDEGLDRDDFATFVELVVEGMDDIAPDLATTFTFAGGDPFIDDPHIDRMVDAVDVLSVNHYCLAPDLRVTDLDDATAAIDRFVDRAGASPVVFQEFGCPAAPSMGASEEYQLEWFQVALAHIGEVEQVRAAFVFEFLDWSQETFDLGYGADVDVLAAEVGDGFVERFTDWLLTSGLVRSDGTTRPAFDLFVETAPAMAAGDS